MCGKILVSFELVRSLTFLVLTGVTLVNVANALSPSPYPSGSLSKGEVGDLGRLQTVDNSKSKSILGIKYKTIEELTRDTLADFESRGW